MGGHTLRMITVEENRFEAFKSMDNKVDIKMA
jgi:hypothetical protein